MMEHIDPEADAYEPGFEMTPKAQLNAEGETRKTFKRVLLAMLLGLFVLSLFHSASLVTYVRGLPIGPVEDTIIAVTEAWHEQMQRNGLTALYGELNAAVVAIHDATWEDVDALLSQSRTGDAPEELRGGVEE
ncbi:hypothetical protein GTQ45_02885 [Pyruvatibacter mobilis]|uniref:Uncharacterized protein n=1 Tax=Pyruvatibacter mobilis TaxID=1712261 RepID=A0A845Q7T0_9HYPH|nr:hypothetical protein [Pyruvatibacter mobilis]NBG94672.1 hypothetical protein [Pyruvatibacter mobilis]QJD74180.1 hypothetical protein HG718_01435 [Pyruvatibacter mobilis]GGD04791.1 hypothetical protein GCM10011587_05760 [Pyruvatibacter mobilis]